MNLNHNHFSLNTMDSSYIEYKMAGNSNQLVVMNGTKTLQTKTIAIENSTYMLTKVMVKVGLNYNFDRYDLIAVVIQHLGPLH